MNGQAMSPDAALPAELAALPAWLAARESAFDDLIPGTEKQIVWHDGPRRQPLAVVYLHGFSATRQETHPLAQRMADALGANLFYTRLKGHGLEDGAAMGEASVEDWLRDGREALAIGERLGERIVVMACSTGATLATTLMMEEGSDRWPVDAMIFVSPNFGVANPAALVFRLPMGNTIARWIAGPEYVYEPRNELHGRYWTQRYPTTAIGTMMALVHRAWRGDPARLDVPVLTFYSPADEVVDVRATRRMQRRFPNPANRLVSVEDAEDSSQHVIAGDILSPGTTDRLARLATRFVASVGGDRGGAVVAGGEAPSTTPGGNPQDDVAADNR